MDNTVSRRSSRIDNDGGLNSKQIEHREERKEQIKVKESRMRDGVSGRIWRK